MADAVIHLSHHQAQAVAQYASRVHRARRNHGLKANARVVVTLGNPYYEGRKPELHNVYLAVEGAAGAPVPLFATDLGHDRDFAPERMPMRDRDGHVNHPDMDGIGWDEYDMTPQLRALGWESSIVAFESDADAAMHNRYDEGNSPDCSYWTPSRPEGEGWLLTSIYDTEEGPVALYVRRAE